MRRVHVYTQCSVVCNERERDVKALSFLTYCMCILMYCNFQEPMFVSGGDKARKLVDLSNFSVYFDTELFGGLEGQPLVVSVHVYLVRFSS